MNQLKLRELQIDAIEDGLFKLGKGECKLNERLDKMEVWVKEAKKV